MDQQHLQQLKKTLLEEKASIEAELSRTAKKNPVIKGDWTTSPRDIADPSDTLDEKAQDVTNFEERRAIEQNLELRLKEIDDTLQQLELGTYGVCVNCARPIDEKRLQAISAVMLCIDCATKATLT